MFSFTKRYGQNKKVKNGYNISGISGHRITPATSCSDGSELPFDLAVGMHRPTVERSTGLG
jgi:hypothetical protein